MPGQGRPHEAGRLKGGRPRGERGRRGRDRRPRSSSSRTAASTTARAARTRAANSATARLHGTTRGRARSGWRGAAHAWGARSDTRRAGARSAAVEVEARWPLPAATGGRSQCGMRECLQVHCAHSLCMQSPVSTSHRRHVLSLLAVMTFEPCGLNATFEISPSCPLSTCRQAPVIVLYSRAVPSVEALTILFPVASKATSSTSSVCPCRTLRQRPASAVS